MILLQTFLHLNTRIFYIVLPKIILLVWNTFRQQNRRIWSQCPNSTEDNRYANLPKIHQNFIEITILEWHLYRHNTKHDMTPEKTLHNTGLVKLELLFHENNYSPFSSHGPPFLCLRRFSAPPGVTWPLWRWFGMAKNSLSSGSGWLVRATADKFPNLSFSSTCSYLFSVVFLPLPWSF